MDSRLKTTISVTRCFWSVLYTLYESSGCNLIDHMYISLAFQGAVTYLVNYRSMRRLPIYLNTEDESKRYLASCHGSRSPGDVFHV